MSSIPRSLFIRDTEFISKTLCMFVLLVSGDPSVPGSADSVPLHLLLHGGAAAVSCSLPHCSGHRLPSRPGCHRTRLVACCKMFKKTYFVPELSFFVCSKRLKIHKKTYFVPELSFFVCSKRLKIQLHSEISKTFCQCSGAGSVFEPSGFRSDSQRYRYGSGFRCGSSHHHQK